MWADENNYIRIELLADLTKKDVTQLEKDVLNISQTVKGEKNILFNIGKSQTTDFEGRKLYSEIARMKIWHKIAIFGGSSSARVLAKFFVATVYLPNKVKLFKTEAEALEWLKT